MGSHSLNQGALHRHHIRSGCAPGVPSHPPLGLALSLTISLSLSLSPAPDCCCARCVLHCSGESSHRYSPHLFGHVCEFPYLFAVWCQSCAISYQKASPFPARGMRVAFFPRPRAPTKKTRPDRLHSEWAFRRRVLPKPKAISP